jgi:hypothetical protein
MARRYVRDKIGRFAAKGGGGKRAGKQSKSTAGRSAKAEYKRASSADRKKHTDMGRKKVIKKQTGKPAFRSNTGFASPQRTKEPRAGSMTKSQRLKARIENRKSSNWALRGNEFKGPKKGTAKQLAAGKKRSAKAKATKAAARKASFKGKATQGRAAKAKYKSAASKLRKKTSGVGINTAKGSKSHKKQVSTAKGQLTRVTNKLTAKRAAATPTKKAATKKRVTKKAAAAKKAKTAATKKALAKSKSYSGLTPKQQYKAARSRVRAEKSGYMQDRGEGYNRAGKVSGKGRVKRSMKYSDYGVKYTNQGSFVGAARAQRTRVKNKLTKGSTQGKGYGLSKKGKAAKAKFRELKRQRGGATKGRGTIAQRKASLNYRTTNQAFGAKNKRPVSKAARDYIGKSNIKEMEAKASRGKGSKAKRRLQNIKGRKG